MAFDPISAAMELGTSVINKIWPDPVKQAEEQRKLQELAQKGDLEVLNAQVRLLVGQLEINKTEAAHKSIFVAGWRPFIGWVCGVALAWSFVGYPICEFVVALVGVSVDLPTVQTESLFELVLGMLGLGGLRTFEKMKGVSREK